MGEYELLIQTIALTLGVAWASGINLYAAVAMLSLGGNLGYIDLPPALEVVQDPLVLVAAAVMYCVEFMADKIPGVDSGWDALHTFIRIPAGALLAAGAVGDVAPALVIAAGLFGGGVSAATHATKSGTRALLNTSPEPFSNWGASLLEDALVIGGLWAALLHPVVFLAAFVVFLLLLCWLLPKLWRTLVLVFRRLGVWLGLIARPDPVSAQIDHHQDLQRLADAGIITEAEYLAARTRIAAR